MSAHPFRRVARNGLACLLIGPGTALSRWGVRVMWPDDRPTEPRETAALRDELVTARESTAHFRRKQHENHAHLQEVHRIVGHVGHLPDGRVRSTSELYAHLHSLMGNLWPTDIAAAEAAADARFAEDLSALYSRLGSTREADQ